jgi:hypothetical protein
MATVRWATAQQSTTTMMIATSGDDEDDDGNGATGDEVDNDGDGKAGDGTMGYDDNDDDGGGTTGDEVKANVRREEEKILRIPPTSDWVEGTGGGVLRGSQCE